LLTQGDNFFILDMSSVFTQMYGNCVCTGIFGDSRRFKHTWIAGTTGLTYGRNVIDIHA